MALPPLAPETDPNWLTPCIRQWRNEGLGQGPLPRWAGAKVQPSLASIGVEIAPLVLGRVSAVFRAF